jgi:Right handed beta helix region
MRRLAALCMLPLAGCGPRDLVVPATGVFRLPVGIAEVHHEVTLPAGAHDLEISGAGTTIRAAKDFRGRAIFAIKAGERIRFHDFTIDGNRDALEQRQGLPGSDTPFRAFTANSGILIEGGGEITVSSVSFRQVAGFSILVSGSKQVRIERVHIQDSGSRNAAGKNNTTGGILLEEGSSDFQVLECGLKNVRGNGIWTHSLYASPRNADGLIARNRLDWIARDAIQVGHATRIKVQYNSGARIGFPEALVDAIPVAIDTAGNVDRSVYLGNEFSEINGKCIDLDGFHDGEVTENKCVHQTNFGMVMNNTNPDMQSKGVTIERNLIDGGQYGGIFVIGGPNRIVQNQLRRLNLSHSGDGLLRSGIYLGRGAERPAVAQGNVIEANEVSGFGMGTDCIGADPAVAVGANTIGRNWCRDSLP